MKKPYVGMHIRIKPTSKLFPGKEAVIAYMGTDGISVYLKDDAFDECVPLNNDEWEPSKKAVRAPAKKATKAKKTKKTPIKARTPRKPDRRSGTKRRRDDKLKARLSHAV